MTDNRTNEPNQNETKSGQEFCFTEAQVEAAAKAMWELRKRASDPDWEGGELDHGIKEIYRQDARAALVAAAGAASQVESECRCTYHSEDRGGGHSELMLEPEPTCPEHGRDLMAPVLPSRTVDEDALAEAVGEEIRRQRTAYAQRVGRVEASPWVDEAALARSVTEWLKKQGR